MRVLTCLFILGAASSVAVAQDSPGAGSLWELLTRGLSWPGYLILAGSATTVALIAHHFIHVRQAVLAPPDQLRSSREQIERRAFRQCFDQAKASRTFFAQVLAASLLQARHGHAAMREAALTKAEELAGDELRRVEYLNLMGNLGPLMGLLGTVFGMIYSFAGLAGGGGEAGNDAGLLAQGISLALVNTLLGLGLGILGLGFYGVCRNRVESFTTHATVRVLDLLEYFRPVTPKPAQESAGPARSPTAADAVAEARTA